GGGQTVVHRGNAEEHRGSVATDSVEDGVGLEAGQENGRGAGEKGPVETDPEAVDVEEGQGQHQAILGGPTPGQPDRLGAGQEVAVGKYGALGVTGGPRRVADEGRVL